MGHEPRNNSNDERVGPLLRPLPRPPPPPPPRACVSVHLDLCSVTDRWSSKHFIHWNQFRIALNPLYGRFIQTKIGQYICCVCTLSKYCTECL